MNFVWVWLDDVRLPPSEGYSWCKTSKEAIDLIKQGNVGNISFDHDLGGDDTGYAVAAFIEEMAHDNKIQRIEWAIHSANPVGRQRIEAAMKRADMFWDEHGRYL